MRLLADAYAAEDLADRMAAGAALSEEQALAHAAAIHETTTNRAAVPPKGAV